MSRGRVVGSLVTAAVVAVSGLVLPVSGSGTTASAAEVVESSVTEFSRVIDNGDGTSTYEVSSMPERVRRDGGWVPVDTTLRKTGSGVVPVAVGADVVLSDGGVGPFLTVSEGGVSVAWSWPAPLPAPVLEGDTAVYPDVLPGVDLRVHVTPTGFGESLVVKTAQAAANPALEAIVFGSTVTGGELVRRPDGGLEVRDASGATVLSGATPMMWDGAGAADGARGTEPKVRPGGPGEDDRAGVVQVVPGGGRTSFTVRPDLSLLRGEGVEYPVVIDPYLSDPAIGRTMLSKNYPSTSYWNWTGSTGAGFDTLSEGLGHYNGIVKRLAWQYNVAPIAGRNVIEAEFSAMQVWAYSCTPSQVNLSVIGPISPSTTWANQPGELLAVGSRTVSFGRETCTAVPGSVDPSDAPVEFDATSAARLAANGGWSTLALKLQAQSETDNVSWKRFAQQATLSITYNDAPNVPTELRLSSPAWYCASGFYRPMFNPGGSAPQISSKATDPNAGQVKVHYEVGSSSGTQTVTTDPANSGNTFTASLPGLTSGSTYAVRAQAQDITENGVPSLTSAWSAPCEFGIDTTEPDAPVATADETDEWYTGGFGLVRIAGSPDTAYFTWSDGLGKSGTVRAVAGQAAFLYGPIGSTTVALTVTARGRTTTATQNATLTVSPITRAAQLRGVWRFEELTGPTAGPSAWDTTAWTTAARPLVAVPVRIATVAGNDTANPEDRGLELRGMPGFATVGPIVEATTPMSLAVKVRGSDQLGVIASQAAASGDAYRLEAVMDGGVRKYRWSVATATGWHSVLSGPASTDENAWDWVVVSATPPSTTAGQLNIFSKARPGFDDFDGPATTLPVGATPVASDPAQGLALGTSYIGVVDDLNVWSGDTTEWWDAEVKFAP